MKLFNSINIFLWLIWFLKFITYGSGDEVESDVEYNFQEPKTCLLSRNETFSNSKLSCIKCHWTRTKDLTSEEMILKSNDDCACPKQYTITKSDKTNENYKCTFCSNGIITNNQKNCINCSDKNPFNNLTGTCQPCPNGYIHVLYNENGSPKNQSECIRCTDGMTPSLSKTKCLPCHSSFPLTYNGTCRCPELTHSLVNGICFLNIIIQDTQIDYKNLYKIHFEKQTIESQFLRENLLSSYYLCKGKYNQTACQLLANICTLQLHSYYGDKNDMNACRMYRNVEKLDIGFGTSSTPIHVPKLDITDHVGLLQKPNLIPYEYHTDFSQSNSNNNNINISVIRFNINGKFIGLNSLIDIIPCQEKSNVKEISQKLGSTIKIQCHIHIKEIFDKYDEGRMEFLDAFLSHMDKNGHKLYNIPLKIQNLQREGDFVNKLEVEEKYRWQLVRRFFIIDTIGGFEGQEKKIKEDNNNERIPKVIRYLENVHVGIQLQNSIDPGKIFIPMITLKYNEMEQENFIKNELIHFTFNIEYYMDMSRSIEDVKIAVGVISSLSVIWGAFQTWSWNRRNGRVEVDIETLINLFITSCGHLADAFFIVCFPTALYWFIFFKKQMSVHVLLPQPEQERIIRDLLITTFSLKIVDMIKLIWRQVSIDIFFIDWERPRARNIISAPTDNKRSDNNNGNTKNQNDPRSEGNVSIWRTYFVANEWNEIQSIRKIHMASQIIITLFFLEIIGFKHWGLYWQDGNLHPGHEAQNVPYSTSARFAVGTLVFGITGIGQWIYRVGFYERYISNKIQDFVDICTLSNISVFILAAKRQGYYVHGRSVHGFADTDMQTMIEQLCREEEDLCGRRGLLPSTDQQTFLISVPRSFRSVYDQVLQPLYVSSNLNAALGRGRQFRTTGKSSLTEKPSSNQLTLSIQAYHSMNRFLTAFLEHALSDLDYDVSDKSFFEHTFDMEFNEIGNDRAVFYNDNGHSFDSVLFYGNERTIFMFNLYTFIFIDILSHNFILAGILTYLFDMILKHIRNFLGRRNLARKTLIDSRFLI